MRSLIKILFGIFLCLVGASCVEDQKRSEDFTAENIFTKGVEGPAVDKEGNLYAVNFEKEGTIGKLGPSGNGDVYITLPKGSVGNGIRFDLDGNMFIADYMGHIVYRIGKGSKTPEIWAKDSTMNQPNDLAIGADNTIYLSDPNWAEASGKLWCVNQERQLVLLEEDMGTTNGVEVSPDGKILYLNESVQRTVWKYDIMPDGSVSNKSKFISFEDFGLDGMRCDVKGNLYITRYDKGTVVVVSPNGDILEEIILKGKKPTNIAFGGKEGKTCYVTMQDRGSIEKFEALNRGSYYSKIH